MTVPSWTAARARMMLDPTVTNLNTGSFGPVSRPVFDHVTELRRQLAEEPMNFIVRVTPPLLWAARERLAGFLGVDPRRLLFTQNVTTSINLVATSLRLAAPGEILLTDHEYGAMHWTWERAAQLLGLTVRTFMLPILAENPQEIVAAAASAITSRTRVFFFSHVLSPTGLVLPARELCQEARRRGVISVVDGAHAPAMVPLDLAGMGCDFYGANCHKWLLAPTGCGFLYFGPGQEDRLQPLQVSWGWRRPAQRLDERDEFGSTPRLRYLEFEGTRDWCPWLAVPAALAFQEELGFENIRRRNAELVDYSRRKLVDVAGTLATPKHPELHGFMTAFRLPAAIDTEKLRQELWAKRIEAPVVERPEGPMIRTSCHFYNTEAEIDRLADVLPEMLRAARK